MPDKAVLDTSVIFAIYFKEKASSRARNIAANYDPITVDLAFAETGNAAWKRITLFNDDADANRDSFTSCIDYIKSCKLLRSSDLATHAYEIAIDDRISFYDALFLAASDEENVPIFTLDKKLYERVKDKRNIRMV
jgi:predicted nucleic acid-binding protein